MKGAGVKPCLGCGKPCRGKNVTTKCRACSQPQALEKACLTCSRMFKAYGGRGIFCSRECIPKKDTPACVVCGQPARSKQAATCSDACALVRRKAVVNAVSRVGCRSESRRARRRQDRKVSYRRKDKAAIIAQLTAEQEGKCAACDLIKPLVLDHDHTTGEPRLLLCTTCNAALGLLHESPDKIRALLTYAEVVCAVQGKSPANTGT